MFLTKIIQPLFFMNLLSMYSPDALIVYSKET